MHFARLVALSSMLALLVIGCGDDEVAPAVDSGLRDGAARDGGGTPDGGEPPDGREMLDGGETFDGGETLDGGETPDGGELPDAWTSMCGDMFVDTALGEECDDGNGIPDDGCEPDCTYTCDGDVDCLDSDLCNGGETCAMPMHVCASGAPLVCTAADACHTASCDASAGCAAALIDVDGDGYAPTSLGACGTDCDDASTSIHPGATEVPGDAGGVDEDCDGTIACFADADGDGYRTALVVASSDGDCADPGEALASAPSGDCNDAVASAHPGASEVAGDAGDVDESCDGVVTCYVNADGDGYRVDTIVSSADLDCADPGEARSSVPSGDCRDDVATVYPGATEVTGDAASYDENCDGTVTCFANVDGDGYRTSVTVTSADADCSDAGEAYAATPGSDCNDTNASVHPGATEAADNGLDDNCNGLYGCYYDADNDGFSRADGAIRDDSSDADCADTGEGAITEPRTDCNDVNAAINPSAREICSDGADQNCVGGADETSECPACSWSGTTRWLSHGWDAGCAFGTGVNVSCNNGRVSYMELTNTCGQSSVPSAMGTGDLQVGCTSWPSATAWISTGFDGPSAFTNGSQITCSGGRVTNMSWEGTSGTTGTFRTGDLGCNWSGAIWLSHGFDAGCAFSSGIAVTCNAGRITHMDATGGCGWMRF